jgi:hypothetical protein
MNDFEPYLNEKGAQILGPFHKACMKFLPEGKMDDLPVYHYGKCPGIKRVPSYEGWKGYQPIGYLLTYWLKKPHLGVLFVIPKDKASPSVKHYRWFSATSKKTMEEVYRKALEYQEQYCSQRNLVRNRFKYNGDGTMQIQMLNDETIEVTIDVADYHRVQKPMWFWNGKQRAETTRFWREEKGAGLMAQFILRSYEREPLYKDNNPRNLTRTNLIEVNKPS